MAAPEEPDGKFSPPESRLYAVVVLLALAGIVAVIVNPAVAIGVAGVIAALVPLVIAFRRR